MNKINYNSFEPLRTNMLKIRYMLKMNQTQFGALFGRGHQAVCHWEGGRNNPPLDVVMKLKKITGHDIDTLVFKEIKTWE